MMEKEKSGRKTDAEVMIGNYAIARGFVEAGIELAAAYPGTPSSEILPGIVEFKKREKMNIHTEWSVNERCAMEVAFGAALSGHKAVCMMKQVGLNVALPSFLHGRKKKMEGSLVIVSCDDPGPQSSQTEQDTRLLALLFGIPVYDPASPAEAADLAYYAVQYSFEHKVPVIVRPTHRVSHAREAIPLYPIGERKVTLQEGVQNPLGVSRKSEVEKYLTPDASRLTAFGVVASGMSYSITMDVLSELGLTDTIPVYKVVHLSASSIQHPASSFSPYASRLTPNGDANSPPSALRNFIDSVDKVLVLEETDIVIEALTGDSKKIFGRRNGYVPGAGELTYDVIRDIIANVVNETKTAKVESVSDRAIEEALKGVHVQPRPPKLCAGCPHRASFYAMRRAFPDAIFPGDIGCYTLGISMGAVDTCLDMGGGVNLAAGFSDAFVQDGNLVPIIASIGDSTFFHAGLAALYDAVKKQKGFILVIMDNGTTAMTGMQPTPQTGITVDGTYTRTARIEDVVTGLGVEFLRILDPYDIPVMISTIREAYTYLQGQNPVSIIDETSSPLSGSPPHASRLTPHDAGGSPDVEPPIESFEGRHGTLNVEQVLLSGPAVIIARRGCILNSKLKPEDICDVGGIEKNCIGCKKCITEFECPALVFDEETKRVVIDDGLCVQCGMCLYACPKQEKGKKLQKQYGKGTTKKKAK